jgi:hypothetical protein
MEGWPSGKAPVQLLDHPPWIVKLPRSSHRLEPGWARKRWGAGPPLSARSGAERRWSTGAMEGAPPAREQVLNACVRP